MAQIQTVRGTHDLLPEDSWKHQHIIQVARHLAQCYGFGEIATPIFEFTQVFNKTLGENSDIVNKEMYTFEDRGGEFLTLRPEGTASIARAIISHGLAQSSPLKYFYQGPMFRYERPQKGRQRQFHQIGVELVGEDSPSSDVEVISMAALILEKLGLKEKYRLEINSIGDNESRKKFKSQLVEYLETYIKDLSEDSQKRLKTNPLRILDSKKKEDKKIIQGAPDIYDILNSESKDNFDQIKENLQNLNIPFTVNPLLVRGLDYYSHCVFEFRTSLLGAQDALLSGGRYNHLIKNMGGPDLPGVGWAAGIERLVLLTKNYPSLPRPLCLIPLGESAEPQIQSLAYELRKQGQYVEVILRGNLTKRMKKASRFKASHVAVIGDEELKNNKITLKDLDSGQQEEISFEELKRRVKL